MKKAVITGGTKLIGTHLSKVLRGRGFVVQVTTTSPRVPEPEINGVQIHHCDVRDVSAMKDICKDAEYLFHLAAQGDQYCIDHPSEAESINVGGTVAALEVARAVGVRKVVFASSAMVYGNQSGVPLGEELQALPEEPYGLYKYWGERAMDFWARAYGVPTTSLRIFNAYGPGDVIGPDGYVIGRFLYLRTKNEPITIDGDGTSTRDYVHAYDIAQAFLLAAEKETLHSGEVINIGSGVETSLAELARLVGGPVKHLSSREGKRGGPERRFADISRAENMLGWTPSVTLADGIEELKHRLGIE